MPAPFTLPPGIGAPVVATAIHAGHDLRDEVRHRMVLDDGDRLREEDPYTDVIASGAGAPVVAHRSRFEVDLNRPRHEAVYRTPDDCWGLDLWHGELPDRVVAGSLATYDAFYRDLGRVLDQMGDRGPFVVFDVHSYNHRRDGVDGPVAPASDNPDVNVGTGSMDRDRWAPVVDAFVGAMGAVEVGGAQLDVRENVRFRGANLARWVHERYPGTGCALALEFKKTFMDEWTGEVFADRLAALRDALATTVQPVARSLDRALVR